MFSSVLTKSGGSHSVKTLLIGGGRPFAILITLAKLVACLGLLICTHWARTTAMASRTSFDNNRPGPAATSGAASDSSPAASVPFARRRLLSGVSVAPSDSVLSAPLDVRRLRFPLASDSSGARGMSTCRYACRLTDDSVARGGSSCFPRHGRWRRRRRQRMRMRQRMRWVPGVDGWKSVVPRRDASMEVGWWM